MATIEVSFRDFAGAVMAGKADEAARALGVLLALDPGRSVAATAHFTKGMASGGQEFMVKAMGLRGAVTSGDESATRQLLADCFALSEPELDGAVASLRARYGS